MPTDRSRSLARALVAVGVAASLAACASHAGAPRDGTRGSAGAASSRAKRDPNLITAEELTHGQWANAYDAVRALRPQWLNFKGADTFLGEQSEVQVRLDDSPLGGIAALRQVTSVGIASIRFVDGVTAAGRWGGAYVNGAILISTMRR
jgi:hypothetical protein